MAGRVKRDRWVAASDESYHRMLQGDKENYGLREVARGFGSRDGFNLNEVSKWGKRRKKKVEAAFKELESLTAQYRYIYRAKSTSKKEQKKLKQAQDITNEGYKTNFKVAFIPISPRVGKSGKVLKPRIYFGSSSVRIKESSGSHSYVRTEIELNQLSLVRNPGRTIIEAIKSQAPNATRFAIQAGPNEIPMFQSIGGLIKDVISLMHKYNGVSALPSSSGNRNDNPALHTWTKWLHGIVAFTFAKKDYEFTRESLNMFRDGNRILRKKRKAERERIRYAEKKAEIERRYGKRR